MFRPANQRGIALLIVVSVLTVIGIMGVAFAFSMYLETESTRQFVSTQQARYLAEADRILKDAGYGEAERKAALAELSCPVCGCAIEI